MKSTSQGRRVAKLAFAPADLLHSTQFMVWVTNARHRCTYVSQPLLNYLGTSEAGMKGLNWLERIHPEDRPECRKNYQRALKCHETYRQEFRAMTAEGTYRWLLDIGVPRFTPQGRFAGYFGLDIDIDDQKGRETTLRDAKVQLEKQVLEVSEREVRRMAGDLHDSLCQQLLGAALKAAALEEWLRQGRGSGPELAAEIRKKIDESLRETRKIARMHSSIGEAAQDFPATLQELAERLRETFGVELRLSIDVDLMTLRGERAVHLYRIIQEAATNSIRHGKAKRIDISIAVAPDQRGCLKIQDDGKGLPRIFRRVDGMGLAMMEYRAGLMGGTFEIAPSPGKGAQITCHFKTGGC